MNAIDYMLRHPAVGVPVTAVCAFVSLCLVARLWLLHRADAVGRKIVWSAIVLVPILGWLFYAAFYRAPQPLTSGGHIEHGRAATSGVIPGQPWR